MKVDNQYLKQLIEKLNTDPNFCDEFFKKESIDEMYEFASNEISGYTKKEFIEMMKSLEQDCNKFAELDESELDEIVGGASLGTEIAATIFKSFVESGGVNLFKKIANNLKKKKAEKAYKQYLKDNNLTEQEVVSQILAEAQKQAINAQVNDVLSAFKLSLLDKDN